MLFTITERNAWEKESWTYLLDLSNQYAEAINWLMIFIRIANQQYKEASENAPTQSFGGPFSSPYKIFAASRYTISFWDEIVEGCKKSTCIRRRHGKDNYTHSTVGGNGGYKSGGNFIAFKISIGKIKSAAITIRDKKENKLYKDFESVFHRIKV